MFLTKMVKHLVSNFLLTVTANTCLPNTWLTGRKSMCMPLLIRQRGTGLVICETGRFLALSLAVTLRNSSTGNPYIR